MSKNNVVTIERIFILLELIGIFILFFSTFLFEFILKELPCPLCLLQRVGFLGIALGLLMNLRFGLRPSHYALSLFSALFTSFVALRQIALHVIPGSSGYGSPIFGLHLYTWAFIISMAAIIATTAMLSVDVQYQFGKVTTRYSKLLLNILFAIMVFFVLANIISVLFICGIFQCPSNPSKYYWLFYYGTR